jgi:hypothetical protein
MVSNSLMPDAQSGLKLNESKIERLQQKPALPVTVLIGNVPVTRLMCLE